MILINCLPLMLLLVVRHMQSSTAVFAESPSQIVSLPLMPNEVAVFRCRHTSLNAEINWRVNGSVLRQFPEIRIGSVNEDGTVVDTLSIPARSEFSGTEVVCRASIDGPPAVTEMTDPVKLLIVIVQLEKVTNLVRNGNTLTWSTPSSPDLTGVDPDIVYCVEVYNITCGRRDLIVGDCNVTEPSYTSDHIAPPGYIYEYTVIPRSNVEGAMNGTSETVEDELIQLSKSGMGQKLVLQMIDSLVTATVRLNTVSKSGNRLPVVPVSYSTTLTSLDGLGDSEGFITNITTRNSDGSVTLVVSSLPFRRVWNATVLAYGCAQHSVVDNGIEIGTHDIYNISLVSLSGIVSVTGDIISGSMSTGILIIAYSLTGETNTHYTLTTFLPDQLRVNTELMGLPSDQYQVSVFVIEESGLPFSTAAATPKTVQVDGQGQLAPPMIEYGITMPDSSSVCITCNFLDNSTTHCLLLVHQRISQLSSSGLMNIVSSHRFNRSGDTAYGCIEGVKLEQYQIGVIGGMLVGQEKDGLHPGVIAVIIILAILVLVGLILTSLILSYAVIRRRKDRQDIPKTIPANCYTTVRSGSKEKTSKEEEAMLESGDELGVQSASVQQVSQEGSKADPVYTCTKPVGPRSRMLQNKESEAEDELGGEYETLPQERIQPTSENRDACEYDVVQSNRREHTQEGQHVNEYDVVARDESEHTKEGTDHYDDIVQGKDKSKQDKYAEVGATSSPRLMVRLDDDKVIYSDVQSPEVEQESQEGADNAVTVVRSSADSESSAGHEVELAMVVMSEAVSAFSSNPSSTDVSELVTLMDGENHVSNEIFDEVRASQCDPINVWQNKDLVLPRYEKATHQFPHTGQTMQLHHRHVPRNTGQE